MWPSLHGTCRVLLAWWIVSAVHAEVALEWVADKDKPEQMMVRVSGLDSRLVKDAKWDEWTQAQWQGLLSVHAGQGELTLNIGLPPMAGKHLAEGQCVSFTPLFPLQPGMSYRAVFRATALPFKVAGARVLTASYQPPKKVAASSTVVSKVLPGADVVPENVLKFYLFFSAPMSGGHIYDHIRLLDEAGKAVGLPFLEIDQELWDPMMTRLTLLLDPGRIKQGLVPFEELGPALQHGKRYTLHIDREWQDAAGSPLARSFSKSFQVAAPDRTVPDPARWKIGVPVAGGRQPLTVTFDEPLDHALAMRLISVRDKASAVIAGEAALTDAERGWEFTPDRVWEAGGYRLQVEPLLEDLAGNSIGKPFEVDVFDGTPEKKREAVSVLFEIRNK